MENIRNHFIEAREVLDSFISDPQNFLHIEQAGKIIVNAIKSGGKVIS
jgi:D-sedoheptulose 7-phosphate isomerase